MCVTRLRTWCGKEFPVFLGGSAKEVLLTIFQKKKKSNSLEVGKWRPVVFFVCLFVAVPKALVCYVQY